MIWIKVSFLKWFHVLSSHHNWLCTEILIQNILLTDFNRQNNTHLLSLILKTCNCATLCGKEALQTRLSYGSWDRKIIQDYLGGPNGALKRKRSGSEWEGLWWWIRGQSQWRCYIADFEDEWGPQGKECKWPLEAKKGKGIYPLLEHPEGMQPFQHLHFRTSAFRDVKTINLCFLSQ